MMMKVLGKKCISLILYSVGDGGTVCVCMCVRIHLNKAVKEEKETENLLEESVHLSLIFLSGNCFIFLRSGVKLAQGKRFSFVTPIMSVFSTPSLPASN